MVGAWCFVDHYGPHDLTTAAPMDVPPHPHTGLQTVSWLLDGEVLHRDSLGSQQMIAPGQLNLMTAGHGIAHSEETPAPEQRTTQALSGVQLWVALPEASRSVAPHFEHHADLPVLASGGLRAQVIMGSVDGATSDAATVLSWSGGMNPYKYGTLGTIAEGGYADIILVDGNPLDDIELMVDPATNFRLIMKDGVIYKNTL